jgi:hypothetical protein
MQPHTHGTEQGHTTQSEAEPKTQNRHRLNTGLNHLSSLGAPEGDVYSSQRETEEKAHQPETKQAAIAHYTAQSKATQRKAKTPNPHQGDIYMIVCRSALFPAPEALQPRRVDTNEFPPTMHLQVASRHRLASCRTMLLAVLVMGVLALVSTAPPLATAQKQLPACRRTYGRSYALLHTRTLQDATSTTPAAPAVPDTPTVPATPDTPATTVNPVTTTPAPKPVEPPAPPPPFPPPHTDFVTIEESPKYSPGATVDIGKVKPFKQAVPPPAIAPVAQGPTPAQLATQEKAQQEASKSKKDTGSSTGVLIGGIVASLVVLAAVVAAIICVRRKKYRNADYEMEVHTFVICFFAPLLDFFSVCSDSARGADPSKNCTPLLTCL